MIDLATALWNQRQETSRAKNRLVRFLSIVDAPDDMDLGTALQLYAFCLEFAPDVIVELGRNYGNSTCVFTEAANRLGKTRVISIDYDPEKAWRLQTAPKLGKTLPAQWFEPLRVLEQNIFNVNFHTILGAENNILLFWDAHGEKLGYHVLENIIPLFEAKSHIVMVHDITDARYFSPDSSYVRADGLQQYWLGDLVSPFEELMPLYDFLSRNRIVFDTPLESLHRKIISDSAMRKELEQSWGEGFPGPTPMETGHWIYFSLTTRSERVQGQDIIFPNYTRIRLAKKIQQLKETAKRISPKPVWRFWRSRKRMRTKETAWGGPFPRQ